MAQAPVYNPEIPELNNGALELDDYLIEGADNNFGASFNSANFGDGGTTVGTSTQRVLDNIFVQIGNKIKQSTKNYTELNRLLTIYNSNFYKNKLSFFLKDDFKEMTITKFDKVLKLIGSDMYNPSSEGLIKVFDISNNSIDEEIDGDIDTFFRRVVIEFDNVVNELFKADSELNNKILSFESMSKSLELLRGLDKNEASDDLYRSISSYMKHFYEECSLESAFKRLINAYSRFLRYREFMKLKTISEREDNEHRLPLCSVCISNPVTWAFTPCGHTFCSNCTQRNVRICYICRVDVNSKLKLFFS